MIKKIIKKMKYGYRYDSNSYIKHLKKCGVEIGNDVIIYFPQETIIEDLNPHLLKIGNRVRMTGPITILTHDYSVFVLNNISNGKIYGKQRPTIIGNNVFIGWGATILCGSNIGNNVIIGAGAVVSGKIDDNSVYAGNPAKKIMTISEYEKKISDRQIDDMIEIYKLYKVRFKFQPSPEIFHEYFQNFSSDFENCNDIFKQKMKNEGNITLNKQYMINNKPRFANYNEFCLYVERSLNDEKN